MNAETEPFKNPEKWRFGGVWLFRTSWRPILNCALTVVKGRIPEGERTVYWRVERVGAKARMLIGRFMASHTSWPEWVSMLENRGLEGSPLHGGSVCCQCHFFFSSWTWTILTCSTHHSHSQPLPNAPPLRERDKPASRGNMGALGALPNM